MSIIIEPSHFFSKIVPDKGVKFVVEWKPMPNHPRGGVMIHHPADTYDEMSQSAKKIDAHGRNAYFAMATFKEVINKEKNGYTYAAGREQTNTHSVQTLWQDFDVGKLDNEGKLKPFAYEARHDALESLSKYISETGMPEPIVVSSGYGFHIYWPFTKPVPIEQWNEVAALQREGFRRCGVKFDPALDINAASILRPVGTHNHKEGKKPKPVTLLYEGSGPVPIEEITSYLKGYLAKAGAAEGSTQPAPVIDSGKTTGQNYPPSDANAIADECNQIGHFRDTGCNDSEPLWHRCSGAIKLCVSGERFIHEWSAKDQRYDQCETQAKIDNWTAGPTTCAEFKRLNPSGCSDCHHTVTAPIQLGVIVGGLSASWLEAMNDKYAWIDKDAGIYRVEYRNFIPMEKFHAAYANQTRTIQTRNGPRKTAISRLWLWNMNRRQHKAIVTRPGEPSVTADGCLNDWAGFSVSPSPGDVSPFRKLYTYLFGDEQFIWLWLAHLAQFPGIKMFVSLVVWSLYEGVGKNLLFETIGALFSRHHYALIGQSEVDDDFTGWIPGTVFVIADEVRASKSEKSRDRLKLWTTATTLKTHDKGQPKRDVDNLMNMVFLSNHADGMFLSDHDRRFYVHEVKAGGLPESLKQEFLAWRANGGLGHLLHYLKSLDLDGLDPKGRAPVTEAKREMIEAGRSDLDRWALDVVSGALPIGREIATAEELTKKFLAEYPQVRTAPQVATVGKVLVRMGAYRRDNQVRRSDGRKVRALALVRTDFWKDQPEAAWRDELEKRT